MTFNVPGFFLSTGEVKQKERERDKEATIQWLMELSALPLTCTWPTGGVKITLEWCLLCHWPTLSRIMDNHHRNHRAAHWRCGVPRWGKGVEVTLFGCHHQ